MHLIKWQYWQALQGALPDQQHKKSLDTVEMGVSLPLLHFYLQDPLFIFWQSYASEHQINQLKKEERG
jgi:hypothetical protein